MYTAAVITVSDRSARGERPDEAGPVVAARLRAAGYEVVLTAIVPDEQDQISQALRDASDERGIALIVTTGGTGFAPRDVTPEATAAVCSRLTPGIPEAMRAASMVDYLRSIGLTLSQKQQAQMLDTAYPFYDYDLLGILKSAFVPQIYIDATDECPNVRDVVALCRRIDALLCYAYLGDVGQSVTGDKKAQKFEDDYLDDVIACLRELGVRAVTYMCCSPSAGATPSRRSSCSTTSIWCSSTFPPSPLCCCSSARRTPANSRPRSTASASNTPWPIPSRSPCATSPTSSANTTTFRRRSRRAALR